MFEIAVRVKELASSNLNNLVDQASSPAKMLKLLQLELEETIISLSGDATRAERRTGHAIAQAAAQDQAAADWQDKAKLALANDRADLARAALGEKENTLASAALSRQSAAQAEAERVTLGAAIADLEIRLAETRERLRAELAKEQTGANAVAATSNRQVDAMSDRIAVLEKRIDFAEAGSDASTKAASLDQELAALQREARLDEELAALKKGMKKGK